jgi:hypothetical protein
VTLPPLAANAVADLLTTNIKRPDGKDATAFNQQRDALVAMRESVMEQEARLERAEAALAALPFPYQGSFTPPGA